MFPSRTKRFHVLDLPFKGIFDDISFWFSPCYYHTLHGICLKRLPTLLGDVLFLASMSYVCR